MSEVASQAKTIPCAPHLNLVALPLSATAHQRLGKSGRKISAQHSSRQLSSVRADLEALFSLLCHSLQPGPAAVASAALLSKFGSFGDAISAPKFELDRIAGLNANAVALLKSVEIAAQKLSQSIINNSPLLKDWRSLEKYLTISMARQRVEVVRALFLNRKNRLIADEVLNKGEVGHVQISCRNILSRALELNSTAVILSHNHPSGDPAPSEDDIDLTQSFVIAGSYMGIVLHDHIIVGKGALFSFRRAGLIK